MANSRIAFESFDSAALRGNPLGDPHVRQVPVYLPPGYDDSTTRYPVVYLLAGFTGSGAMMLNLSAWEENLQARMDRLIASGAILPMILVLPDCFTRYGGSQYVNSSAVGRYDDYLVELVGFIDAKFRTRPDRDFRGVAGKSSGGYGSLVLGMRHPDVFGLVADHSGDKYFEYCYLPDFPKFLNALQKYKDPQALLADPSKLKPKGSDFFNFMNIAAMAACYSPDEKAPLGFELPFDLHTGELRPAVWERWKAADPLALVDKYADALRSLKLLFMDCGTRDEFNLLYGCRILHQRYDALNIPHQYEEFDDGHRNISYRLDVSLAAFSQTMG